MDKKKPSPDEAKTIMDKVQVLGRIAPELLELTGIPMIYIQYEGTNFKILTGGWPEMDDGCPICAAHFGQTVITAAQRKTCPCAMCVDARKALGETLERKPDDAPSPQPARPEVLVSN